MLLTTILTITIKLIDILLIDIVHTTRHVVLYNFPLSVTLGAALTMSQSSPSYSSHLSRHYTRRVLLAIVLAASTLIDIVLVTVYVHLPSPSSVTLRAALTCHKARHHTRRVLLAIMLTASYSLSSPPPASSPSSP